LTDIARIATTIAAEHIEAAGVRVFLDIGEKLSDTDLDRLSKRLKQIAALGNDIERAKIRWLDERKANTEWEKDRRALFIVTGFFEDKQGFLPLKLQTIAKRLGGIRRNPFSGPVNLIFGFGLKPEKWLKGIVSLARGFLKSIKQWKKRGVDLPTNFNVSGFNVVNAASLTAAQLKPFLDYVKKAAKYVPANVLYGDLRVTTKKELPKQARTLAYYNKSADTMSLIVDAKDAHPVYSIAHELGHRVEHKFFKNMREMVELYREGGGKGIEQNDVFEFSDALWKMSSSAHMDDIAAVIKEQDSELFERVKGIVRAIAAKYDEIMHTVRKLGKTYGVKIPSSKRLQGTIAKWIFSFSDGKDKLFRDFTSAGVDIRSHVIGWLYELQKIHDVNQLVADIMRSTSSESGGLFPTPYSRTDVDEFFAENYVAYKMGKKVHPKVAELLKGY